MAAGELDPSRTAQANRASTGELALSAYFELNESFGDPFVYALTRRGFFSEVNNLLGAIAFGLRNRRRLIVEQSGFGDHHWEDFFDCTLPAATDEAGTDPDWLIRGVASPHFRTIRQENKRVWQDGERTDIGPLGIEGVDFFTLRRLLAGVFCRPIPGEDHHIPDAPVVRFGSIELLQGDFATLQIRRGDKLDKRINQFGELAPEGDDVPVVRFLEAVGERSPDIGTIMVMTDDYTVIEEIEAHGTSYRIATLCTPDQRGHRTAEFKRLNLEERQRRLKDLLIEAEIAARSALFVGGYRSNVARYIANVHRNPAACMSVDSSRRWHPL